ncbi:MAG: hypothetical protein GXY17_02450 [Clostridiaceae bacterium]|jgi:hypothetical protein|nr:hypothetical protein [Clostridiaceae bacterium]
MNIIRTTFRAVIKQPPILIIIASIMLAAAIFNAFIPLMAMIIGVINMAGGGFFDSVLSIVHMVTDQDNIPTILILLAALTGIGSVAIGLLLPGFLLLVDDGIGKGQRKKGLFAEGIKKYFFKFFPMALLTALVSLLLAVFLLISSVPAIIVTRAAMTTKPDLLIAAAFLDIVTIGVFFMCLSFFSAYIYMWYIAASTGVEKPFRIGKAIADCKFWRLALGLLIFDIVFAIVIYLIYSFDSQILRYVTGWLFTTAFFTTLAVYLVHFYKNPSGPVDNVR